MQLSSTEAAAVIAVRLRVFFWETKRRSWIQPAEAKDDIDGQDEE